MEPNNQGIEVTYKFLLPQHKRELDCAYYADDMAQALWDIDQKCRDVIKYGTKSTVDELAEQIRSIISENVSLHKVWY